MSNHNGHPQKKGIAGNNVITAEKPNSKDITVNERVERVAAMQQVVLDSLSRINLAGQLGVQYGGDRKVYQALGYPDEKDLVFKYYYKRYERQDIASAIIDRPVDKTWDGSLTLRQVDTQPEQDQIGKAWKDLDREFKVKSTLTKLDKLMNIGQFALLLFGFDDVKKAEDFKMPVTGTRKLKYLKQVPESSVSIKTYEKNAGNARYGLPKIYEIKVGVAGDEGKEATINVHHTRVLHVLQDNLSSEIYGRPKLKPVINRLVDLEKLLGGDAEMFWRGARPGYHADVKDEYEMSDTDITNLESELDKYEHDLRRFISAKGVNINALEQQIADPLGHIDAQLQAISSQTGIPKRVLIGSERGELSSTQDKDQWLSLIATRMTELAEPIILRPFIDKCIEVGILPDKEYMVVWEDVFAPSDEQKAKIGKQRSDALKAYSDSPFASEIIPPQLVHKYILGLSDDQAEEVTQALEEAARIEDRSQSQPQVQPVNPAP